MKKILLSILFVSSSFSMGNLAEELKGICAQKKVLNHHVLEKVLSHCVLEVEKLKQEKQITDLSLEAQDKMVYLLKERVPHLDKRVSLLRKQVSYLEDSVSSLKKRVSYLDNIVPSLRNIAYLLRDKISLLEEKQASTELLLKDQIDKVSLLEEKQNRTEKDASIWNPEEFLVDYEEVCDTFEKTLSNIYSSAEKQMDLFYLFSISQKSLVDFIQLKCYNKTGYGISRIGRSEYLPDIMFFPAKLGKYIWSRDKLKHGKAYDYDIIEHKNYHDERVNAFNSNLHKISSIKENERTEEMKYFLSLSSEADQFEFCKNELKTIFDEANIKFEDAKKPLFDFLDKYEHFWSGKQ